MGNKNFRAIKKMAKHNKIMKKVYFKNAKGVRALVLQVAILVFFLNVTNITVFSQNEFMRKVAGYVPSRLRALDRDRLDRKATMQTREGIPLVQMTASQKFAQLVQDYVADGFTKVTLPADAIVPTVQYYNEDGVETDDYRFYIGVIGTKTEPDIPFTFRHVGNVNKFIEGEYQKTLFGNGTIASHGYNILTEAQAQNLETNSSSTSRGVMRAARWAAKDVAFLYKALPAVGNRGVSQEIVLLSIPPAIDDDIYNKQPNLKGVHETRMYPDDYVPIIYTEYKFHFTDDHDGNAYFLYHIDNQFGTNDKVPVYRQANKRGMYMEAAFRTASMEPETYRFNYTIPKLRGREPKQYMAAARLDPTYKPFGGLKTGDGGEAGDTDILLPNDDPIYAYNVDAAMFFKNKGKHYVSGEVFTTTLVQGVSAIILPELEFDGGFLDFDSPYGQNFDLEDVGLVWIDTNAGDKSVHVGEPDNNISLGGTVTYIKMDGAEEVGELVTVGTYERESMHDPTTGDLTYLSDTSYVIPASQLQSGRNVFKFTITNNVRQEGEIIHTSNIYLVTVNVPYVVEVAYKTLSGSSLTPPVGYETNFQGEFGDPFVVTFPKVFGAYEFVNATPELSYESINATHNKIETEFSDEVNLITLNYFAKEVDVTISFRRQGAGDRKIYKDISVNLDYVEDYTIAVEPGTKIADVLQSLLTSGAIRLDYDGYSAVTVDDYEMPGMVIKPTEVPDQAINLVYKYSGVRSSLE